MAETGALAGALNDAGDVRHDEAGFLIDVHHAEVGEEGGEVIVRDLRLRLGHDGEQRRLADVREADQPHVREELEL